MRRVAAILVGGKGTRLQPLISHLPKPLAPVGNEPFLYLLIKHLARLQITDIVLLTGYMHEAIVEACGQGERWDVQIHYSQELTPLGTAGALWQARELLAQVPEFLLLNGDTYLDCNLAPFVSTPLDYNALARIGVIPVQRNDRYGAINFDPDSFRITSFQEKLPNSAGYVSAGIYKLHRQLLTYLDNRFSSLEVDIFPKLIAEQKVVQAYPLAGQFYDIGLPESYMQFKAAQEQAS